MSNLKSIKSYQGFEEGIYVTRKGRICLIKKIHFEMHPPSVTVLMMDNNTEIGTEFDRLKQIKSWFCGICTAENTDNAANTCFFCKTKRTFKEKIIIKEQQENMEKNGENQQQQTKQQQVPQKIETEQENEEEEEYEEEEDEEELSQSMSDEEEDENHYKYDYIDNNIMNDNYYRNRHRQYPQYNRNNQRFRNNNPSPFMRMSGFW